MPHTVLDPHETNAPVTTDDTPWGMTVAADDPEVTFRHSGWKRQRALIRNALVASHVSPRALSRFDLCGSEPWLAQNAADPSEFCILTNTCRNRWCRPCSNARAQRIEDNLRTRLSDKPHRFITLTLKHEPGPLRDQLDRLYECFRQLRRATFWKRHVTGGAAVLEIGHSHHDDTWHPHLHIVVEGKYIPHGQLSDLWRTITGDSFIVHVQYVRTAPHITAYLAKYLRKPVNARIINKPDQLLELITAVKHRRLCTTFGTWRLWPLTKSQSATVWEPLAPLAVIVERADAGGILAKHQIDCLLSSHPEYMTNYLATHPPPE